MEQTVIYTPDQVPGLFRDLREKIRRETSPEAAGGSAVLPGLESPALAAWNPARDLSDIRPTSDPHFHSVSELAFTGLAGLIAKNAAARARKQSGRPNRRSAVVCVPK